MSGLVVLKLGGRVAADAVRDALSRAGGPAVVVHGAGPQITEQMARRGIEPVFVRGRRMTTPEVLEVVRASLEAVNREVCAAIGPVAQALRGEEIGLRARRVPALGLVGEPEPSAPVAIRDALRAGRVPVVSPLAEGPLNVNADEAAAALSVGLGADKLLFVTDVPGLLLGGAVASTIRVAEAERLLEAGELGGGIVPKLQAAVVATRGGVDATIGATAVVA